MIVDRNTPIRHASRQLGFALYGMTARRHDTGEMHRHAEKIENAISDLVDAAVEEFKKRLAE